LPDAAGPSMAITGGGVTEFFPADSHGDDDA
jgi:hypothetical protein